MSEPSPDSTPHLWTLRLTRWITALLLFSLLATSNLFGSERDVIQVLQAGGKSKIAAEATWTAKKQQHPPEVPTLRPLKGFPVRSKRAPDYDHFQRLFNAGVRHECALVAVGPIQA